MSRKTVSPFVTLALILLSAAWPILAATAAHFAPAWLEGGVVLTSFITGVPLVISTFFIAVDETNWSDWSAIKKFFIWITS